jgi:hypothetical protein
MNWKTLERQIRELKLRHRGDRYRPPMPDLSFDRRGSPCRNVIPRGSCTALKTPAPGSKQFAIGDNHKQGLERLTSAMIQHDLEYLGGKKTWPKLIRKN